LKDQYIAQPIAAENLAVQSALLTSEGRLLARKGLQWTRWSAVGTGSREGRMRSSKPASIKPDKIVHDFIGHRHVSSSGRWSWALFSADESRKRRLASIRRSNRRQHRAARHQRAGGRRSSRARTSSPVASRTDTPMIVNWCLVKSLCQKQS